MNVNDFITQIQGLYGQYNSMQRVHVAEWISNIKPDLLPVLLKQVVESVSWTHNKRPPGLAEFNSALKEIRKNGEIEYYQPPQLEEDELPAEKATEMFKTMKRLAKEKKLKKEGKR